MVEERVQRRLAAILAADVVGYSRLMGEDEAGTRARFNAHLQDLIEPAIAGRQGRIVKTTGDGLLVEFASVIDAVECAVRIQKAMADRNADEPEDRRIEFRIGVNLGDVIIEGDDIHGDGVNVAARLEGLAETGGICVSSDVYRQARGKVDFAFEDLGEQDVKNIAVPVRAYRVRSEIPADQQISAPAKPGLHRKWLAAAAAIILLIGAFAAWNFYVDTPATVATADAKRLSIVVLPFDNLSGDAKQDYLADGITEDLITDLSRIRDAFVIARGTSFTFKGKTADPKAVAKDLNVRYVLEGSVRRAGDQVRVNAQLIDGANGAHLWSERFDRTFENVFSVQNEIVGRLARTLKQELLRAESHQKAKGPPGNPQAWDYALQAYVTLHDFSGDSKERWIGGKQLAEKAIELDPRSVRGWIALSEVHYRDFLRGYGGNSKSWSREQMLAAANKAAQIDIKNADAYTQLGLAYRLNRQFDKAEPACRRALDLNPNHDDALICLALAKIAIGKTMEAFPLLEKSRRLNPRYRSFRRDQFTGYAKLLAQQHEEAVRWIQKAIASRPHSRSKSRHIWLASALAWLDRKDEARKALSTYWNGSRASRTIAQFKKSRGHLSPHMEHVYEGLRRAGMPEK